MFRLLIFSILSCLGYTLHAQQKISLHEDMLYNLSAKGDASLLINEQQQAGNPRVQKNDYVPTGNFFGSYNSMYYPIHIVIDLGTPYRLSDIFAFDTHNKDSIRIYSGSPRQWKRLGALYTGGYNRWIGLKLEGTSRYVMLEFPSTKANISEIVLYGEPTAPSPEAPTPVKHSLPQFQNLMGVNAVHSHPKDKMQCVGTVREYHPWQWDEGNESENYPGYPNNQFGWNPSWVGGKWPWNFDKTYRAFKDRGLDVSPCLQQNALYMLREPGKKEWKPISKCDDPEDPASYKEHARYMFQFAARYGATRVAPEKLMLEGRNEPNSGLGLIQYMEHWNEPDKWWRGREGYFTPFELAAMCSADYDGHEGALGEGYGAKNADPHMKFVMGGLADMSLDYIKAMKLWSDTYRKSGFPADVLNVHHYSNISGGQEANLKKAISPEDDSLKYKLKELVYYRDRHLPGKEIWLSEFGYDTNPNSPQGVKSIGDNSSLLVQAQWLVRSFLEMAAAGIDRAHVYFFADLNSKNPNKFNSSGVVNEKWFKFQPKPSWFFLYTLKTILGPYIFDSEINSGEEDINVYKFENPDDASCIYAVWCTTSEDKKVPNYNLAIEGTKASLMQLSSDSITPEKSQLPITDKKVTVALSETPIFIKVW